MKKCLPITKNFLLQLKDITVVAFRDIRIGAIIWYNDVKKCFIKEKEEVKPNE